MPWQSNPNPAYGRAAWRKARAAALERARGRCEIGGPGCLGVATSVDHVFGLKADPEHRHLQAACEVCHKAKTSRESHGRPHDPPAQPRTKW